MGILPMRGMGVPPMCDAGILPAVVAPAPLPPPWRERDGAWHGVAENRGRYPIICLLRGVRARSFRASRPRVLAWSVGPACARAWPRTSEGTGSPASSDGVPVRVVKAESHVDKSGASLTAATRHASISSMGGINEQLAGRTSGQSAGRGTGRIFRRPQQPAKHRAAHGPAFTAEEAKHGDKLIGDCPYFPQLPTAARATRLSPITPRRNR